MQREIRLSVCRYAAFTIHCSTSRVHEKVVPLGRINPENGKYAKYTG